MKEPLRLRRPASRDAPRRAVEECLVRWGLLRRPRALLGVPEEEKAFGRRLRGALQELGPVFSELGLYLASRVDLLPAADCRELADLSGSQPPLPVAEVAARAAAEVGQPAETIFAGLEPFPAESRLLAQVHRARLADGRPVIVRLARPEALEAARSDLDRLPALAGAFAALGWSAAAFAEVIADFERSLRERIDLRATAEALELLAVDAEDFGLLVPPVVCRELSTEHLLIVEDPGGAGLEAPQSGLERRRERARLIAVPWLRQALLGRVFPVGLLDAELRVLENGRTAWLAGAFARPPAAARASLRGFLIALAAREPDEACSHLLREMTREPEASEEGLRLQMRQIVPFRDGAWSAGGESLAEHVFVCARQAWACGFRPRRQLVAFYRGFAAVAAAVRDLVPEEDALLAALHEVRVLAGLAQVREAMSMQWNGQWGRYAALMVDLPRKMDEMLTRAAEGGVRPGGPEPARPPRGEERPHLLLAAVLMVLVALALLGRHFVQAGALAGRGEAVAAALFLAGGGFLLWILTRG
jgi:ubiquinone biosynthesis protein